jgi:hypothetical protein
VQSRQVKPGAYHVQQVKSQESIHDQLRGMQNRDRYRLHATVGVVTVGPPFSSAQENYRKKERIKTDGVIFHPQISGYLDGLTFEAAVQVTIFGIHLGTFHGNPEDMPFTIDIDLEFVKGSLQLQTRDQSELWLHVDTVILQLDPISKQIQSVPCMKSVRLRSLPEVRCEPWIPVSGGTSNQVQAI